MHGLFSPLDCRREFVPDVLRDWSFVVFGGASGLDDHDADVLRG